MSYDIAICIKAAVGGSQDKFFMIAEPEMCNPTYNYRKLFVNCMDWDYHQSTENEDGKYVKQYYDCAFVMERIDRGISELVRNTDCYKQYVPPNGWGTLDGALSCLESFKKCILETSERYDTPLQDLWFSW